MEEKQIPTAEMVFIPGGKYLYHATHRFREGGFILFDEGPRLVEMSDFYIDRFEVTNADYKRFLDSTKYQPTVQHNFLRHWSYGYPGELANHPVTWISLEDARAYAIWAGKRLPSDMEWQRAAQGDDGRKWPWGDHFDPTNCNSDNPGTTPVDAFPRNCSSYGVCDLVGNVWEWIDGIVSDGWHNWCFIRGGSYYKAKGSMWYVEGGAQPVHHHHKFLMMNPSLDRCATVGFRCACSKNRTIVNGYVIDN
jgi:formylglycine-generating enzyme required for sulfatase activity